MSRLLQWLFEQEWFAWLTRPLFGLFDPFLPEFRSDPHPIWTRLRETAPVYRSRIFSCWLVSRYDDAVMVLRDKRFSADRSGIAPIRFVLWRGRDSPDFQSLVRRNLLNMEGPEHTRLRALVANAFTPRRIEALRPRVQEIADELLDAAAEQEEMEFVRDFARPLPLIVIADMLGVPRADRARFQSWSHALAGLVDPLQAPEGMRGVIEAAGELASYLRPLLAERRIAPRDDLLSAMIAAEENGDHLDEGALLALSSLILVAGHETTTGALSNAVLALLRNPGERKRLQQQPELLPTAVDELLRFDSPVVLTDRIALEDVEIGGRRIRKGQIVGVLLAAANRDPERFEDAERLDVGREGPPHLAFSHGAHFCLGAQLARMEIEIGVGTLLRRFPHFSGSPDGLAWRRSMVLRGPLALPLRLGG